MGRISDAITLTKDSGDSASQPRDSAGDRFKGTFLRRRLRVEDHDSSWIDSIPERMTAASEGDPESRVLIGTDHDDRVMSAYKMLRTRTLKRVRQNNWQVIGITSPVQGDGKSLTSINLALSLARDQSVSVVLVELDLRRPSICKQMGVDPVRGLSDYLDGSCDIENVLFRPAGTERLAILPSTEVFENSSETLSSLQVIELIETIKNKSPGTIVVCDLPPYLVTDDVLAFAHMVDAFLIVMTEGKTSRDVVARGAEILEELPLLGVVLNKSDEATASYYY
jgi:capsular exopolysaccharide synthesis family protein